MLAEILNKTKLDIRDLVAVYPYGSRVYGNARKNSDYDFIVVTTNKTNEQYSDNLINVNFYTPDEHQQRLSDHEISALECYFLPDEKVLYNSFHSLNRKNRFEFTFVLNLVKLRHALSAKSSNSWVKAKKKLTVEKDYDLDLGRKSLFHAIRIIDYGIQIATYKKIVDYGSCNKLFEDIMNCYTWSEMFGEYKQFYNNICSEFRIVAPKE
jgi:predicted nucleotidyltransferase